MAPALPAWRMATIARKEMPTVDSLPHLVIICWDASLGCGMASAVNACRMATLPGKRSRLHGPGADPGLCH